MTTETAQRRLLEALAGANNAPTPDIGSAGSPLRALAYGFRYARDFATDNDQPETALIYDAMAVLAEAVDVETRKVTSHD